MPDDGSIRSRPRDIDLFTSGALFGQPGIYPDGAPMAPAEGGPVSTPAAASALALAAPPDALKLFSSPDLAALVPDVGVRAGLCCLAGTIAAPVLDAFPAGTTASALRYGRPASPGRVVGPPADPDPDEPGLRVVNDRYQAEHPALLAGSIAHDLLWSPDLAVHAAEATLHAVVAMVHIQVLARWPALAALGTELCRRQNSMAITLLNSRHPGSTDILLVAPDGLGTIPGGDPKMQTPDFWSVPFAPVGSVEAPPLLRELVAGSVRRRTTVPDPLVLDEAFGPWWSEHLDPDWLSPSQLRSVRATLTLGL